MLATFKREGEENLEVSIYQTPYVTREAWLHAGSEAMNPWLRHLNVATPEIRVSVGYGKTASKVAIGWCMKNEQVSDFKSPIFISPEIERPETVLATLLHEKIHASDNCESKHGGHFRNIALALGLEPPMTATTPGEALFLRLQQLADELGPYPHTKIVPMQIEKKQGIRQLKASCPNDGMVVRLTRKWIDSVGLPVCACGTRFVEAERLEGEPA